MELHAVKTFYSEREGLVTLDDDVLSIVRQVRELYGDRVTISLEPTTGQYVFAEHCEDGTERLIFTSEHLDGRDLERLMQADSQSRGHEDQYDRAEREQDEVKRQLEEQQGEAMKEAHERLAHAIKKDGFAASPWPSSVQVPRGLDG